MKTIILIALTLSAQIIFAGITQDQIDIKTEMNTIQITPKKGFHINDKAPASATYDRLKILGRPKTKTEQMLVYVSPPNTKTANLKFFVCDDAKTVCEQHEKSVQLAKDSEIKNETKNKPTPAAINKYTNSKKPTLLIFSAPWCPACIRMASEVYTQKNIKKIFSKLNVQKINIDLIENEKISDQFSVKAIPTLVLLNTSGQEIYRWLDYQSAATFSKELAAESKNSESIDKLKIKADSGDVKSIEKLAKIYFGKMDWQNAAKYFALLKDENSKKQKLNCEINFLSDNKDNDDLAKTAYVLGLDRAINETISKIDKIRWQLDLIEIKDLKKDAAQIAQAEKIRSELNQIIADKNINQIFSESTIGDLAGFELAEALDMRGRAEYFLNKLDDKKITQQKISENILSKKHDVNFPGQMISAIGYLNQAEKFPEAEKLILLLVEMYPKTYVYHQRYASFLLKQKRHEEALKKINEALTYQEGNLPQLSITKIKILKALDKKSDALVLTEEMLKFVEIAPDKYKRTKVTLQDFQKEFTKK